MEILVIEDEESTINTIKHYAAKRLYHVTGMQNAHDGLAAFKRLEPDIVILDVMLPGLNGFEVCEQIKALDATVPIIFLSVKGDIVDKTIGFKLGADDYITKPFDPDELMMRIEACYRRYSALTSATNIQESITFDDLVIDFTHRVAYLSNKPILLTSREFNLLALLAKNPGSVVSKQQILYTVWGENYFGDPGVVAVFVRRIRQKIEKDPANPTHLLTEWGYGYRLS